MKHAILIKEEGAGETIQIIGSFVQGRDTIISIKEYEKIKERYENIQKLKSQIFFLEEELKKAKKAIHARVDKVFIEHSELDSCQNRSDLVA